MTYDQVNSFFSAHGRFVSLADIEDAGAQAGLSLYSVKTDMVDILRSRPVFIAHMKPDHFVAVVGYSSEGLLISDRRSPSDTETQYWSCLRFASSFSGEALVLR